MTRVIINPGTEAVENATLENARENMKQLVIDCGFSLDEIVIFETGKERYHDGRFKFTLSRIGYQGVEIDMPGLPLEQVRYLGWPSQGIWDFPRLYIDGSSFVWKYVVNLAKGQLNTRPGEEDETG